MPSTYCISLSIAVLCRWPCDRSTVRCVCVCVCHGESSELLKSTEPRGENLLAGIFENAFKWMKLFPLFPRSTASSHPSLPCLELAPAVWRLCGRVSRCKLNEACASFSRSHAYFLARTSTEQRGSSTSSSLCGQAKPFGLLFCICFRPRSRLTCIDWSRQPLQLPVQPRRRPRRRLSCKSVVAISAWSLARCQVNCLPLYPCHAP